MGGQRALVYPYDLTNGRENRTADGPHSLHSDARGGFINYVQCASRNGFVLNY